VVIEGIAVKLMEIKNVAFKFMATEGDTAGWNDTGDLMGYAGQQFRMPLTDTGFRDDRNTQLLPPTSLLIPSANLNYHENGLSKRGGTAIEVVGGGHAGQGMFQFLTPTIQKLVFVSNGVLYNTNYSNVLFSGFSKTNPVNFCQTSKYVFAADGQANPQYWDGSAGSSSNVEPASSWTGNMPIQMVVHTRAGSGAGDRLWAVTPDSLWYSDINAPTKFGSGTAGQLPIDSIGGLVGAYDLGGQLFAFSKTQTFLIQDTDSMIANWGYINALWEGGVASWRLIDKAMNNLYFMAEDGLIYNLAGVLTTGAYNAAPLNRPAFVDKFIRDNVSLGNIQNFHVAYDRKLRALKFFMQQGGSVNNIGLTYFIDKRPESAWIVHNNTNYTSGYNASCSCEVRVSAGNYQIWTMDYTGNVWGLEQTTRDDNGNPYSVIINTKAQDLGGSGGSQTGIPRSNKHWMAIALRGDFQGTSNFTLTPTVEGVALPTQTFQIQAAGAEFNFATFNNAVFATDILTTAPVGLGYYGRDLQLQFNENEVGVDFFLAEILYMVKPLGIKVAQ